MGRIHFETEGVKVATAWGLGLRWEKGGTLGLTVFSGVIRKSSVTSFQGLLRAGLSLRLTLCPLSKFIWELKERGRYWSQLRAG